MVNTPLAGQSPKQKAEASNFERFNTANPNFAGRTIVCTKWGGDPPDVLCLDGEGKRIGIELVQWVNERQVKASKQRYKCEDSYRVAIRSSCEKPPANIGFGLIYPKDKTGLAPHDAITFCAELYTFVANLDAHWLENPYRDDPQGVPISDFAGYPRLARYLTSVVFYARGNRFNFSLGAEWLTFEDHGSAYTTDWMRDALLDNVGRKIVKYSKPSVHLQQQRLSEFYLLAYYDEAAIHNTPYDSPSYGFSEIAALVTCELAKAPHPFDRVFLYSPIEQTPVIQVWPR